MLAPEVHTVRVAVVRQAVGRQRFANRNAYECDAVGAPLLLEALGARRLPEPCLRLVGSDLQAKSPEGALGSGRHLSRKLRRDQDGHVVEKSKHSDAVWVHTAGPSGLPQVCFELSKPGCQSAGEKQRRQWVSLVHAARGGQLSAATSVVPEEIPGKPARETVSARDRLWQASSPGARKRPAH